MNQSFPNSFQGFNQMTGQNQPKILEIRQVFFEHFLYPAPSRMSFGQLATLLSTLKSVSQGERIQVDTFSQHLAQQFSAINEADARHIFLMHQIAFQQSTQTQQSDFAELRSLGLFLFIQTVQLHNRHSISLENRVKDFNIQNDSKYIEGYKQTGFSPLNSPRAKTMRAHTSSNEGQQILNFLKQNARQMLKIVSLNMDVEDEKAIVTDKAFNFLQLIFTGEKLPISSLAFERNTRMLLPQLVDWLIRNIGVDENEIQIVSGFTKSVTLNFSMKKQKYSNEINSSGSDLTITSNSDVRITQCEDSHIFIDHSLSTLSISQCQNCVIFVSSVRYVTSVTLCDRVTLCIASQILRISNTIDSIFHYFGSQQPVLYGDCRNTTLGPHNGNTLKILERVREASIPIIHKNAELFSKPLILQGNQNIDFNTVTPEDLCTHSLPEESFSAINYSLIEECGFDIDRIGKELTERKILQQPLVLDRIFIPPLAPQEYQKVIFQRYKGFADLQQKLKLSGFKDDDIKLLQQAIQGNFREWLVTTGLIKPISDLVKLIDDQN